MHNNELYHHGVKGQKWGVENGPPYPLGSGMSERTARSRAKKDAKEYARAKMFYGEGSGNRRKLIKNIVAERSKDPTYKQAFEESLAKQDMAKHAQKAKSERHRKDASEQVKKNRTWNCKHRDRTSRARWRRTRGCRRCCWSGS